MADSLSPSSLLVSANQKLLHWRQQRAKDFRQLKQLEGGSLTAVQPITLEAKVVNLPPHLGWESEQVTAVLRQCHQQSVNLDPVWQAHLPTKTNALIQTPSQPLSQDIYTNNWVKLYPAIGLGMLQQEVAPSGRLWLLLRYLDEEGTGALRIDVITKIFTAKSTTLYLCGKRQLRNLLRDGENIFWTRDKTQLWLRSAAKVAYALNVVRLTGHPIALPLEAMLSGLGVFRAHLYAAFHSGRVSDDMPQEKARPIARDTVAELSGVGRSSQRVYEKRLGLKIQFNFAVGHVLTKECQEEQAWKHGQALFELKDYRGQQGQKGKTYLAWQLPNTYHGHHQHRPKGRQKRINRELNDLVMQGVPGNVEGTIDTPRLAKRYLLNRALVATPKEALYWRSHNRRNGRYALWHLL